MEIGKMLFAAWVLGFIPGVICGMAAANADRKGKRMAKCKSCGADIVWIKTKRGKMMPCNPTAIAYRFAERCETDALMMVTEDGKVDRGVPDACSWMTGYVSHFATCPYAEKHRRLKYG